MNYGKLLKQIREGKKISVDYLSKKSLVSKSQIYRFESNESDIILTNLKHILKSLNISLEEFSLLASIDSDNFKSKMTDIKFFANHHKVSELKNILTNDRDFNPKINRLNHILIKSIISTFDKSLSPSIDEVAYITDYLFKTEFWTYYEIILLGNSIRYVNINTAFILTQELLKRSQHQLVISNLKLVIQMSINCAISCIDNNKIENAKKLLIQIKDIIDIEPFFFEKNVYLYVKGYLEYRQNNINGLDQMQNALNVFFILDKEGTYKNYYSHYLSIQKD